MNKEKDKEEFSLATKSVEINHALDSAALYIYVKLDDELKKGVNLPESVISLVRAYNREFFNSLLTEPAIDLIVLKMAKLHEFRYKNSKDVNG